MNARPMVSIIMPAYNASKTITDSINCVLAQTYEHWELLIINDGSTDNTWKVLTQFDERRIKVFTQVNKGVAVARNTGLKHAQGEYIAFLDSDDLWLTTKLEKQILLFEGSSNRLGLIYTKYRSFYKDISRSFSMDIDAPIGYLNPYHRLLIMDYVPTLTVMIKASIVNDIGYFSEDLRGTEDWDYWIRIAKSYRIERLNEELAFYRISPNSLSRNKDKHSIEELKVLDRHLTGKLDIPPTVCHMAHTFWYFKKIRHQLASGHFKNVINSTLLLIQLRPIYLINFFLMIVWISCYIYQRVIVNLTRNIIR
jgi:glycosyltransferase involved in cell wall biosynthesis